MKPESDLLDLLDFTPRRSRAGGVESWTGHQPFAYRLVSEMRPSTIVELGTHYGESFFTFCQAVSDLGLACKCYAVDTWQGDHQAGFYGDDVYGDVSRHNEAHYGAFASLLRMTFDEAAERFSDESVDILHIDGLHTYEAVKHDFETWFPRVRKGGIVLFHDTSVRREDFGVWKFWEEVAAGREHFSFTHSSGLGVLRKPGGAELAGGSVATLVSTAPSGDKDRLRKFFAMFGRYVAEGDRLDEIAEGRGNQGQELGRALRRNARLRRKLRISYAIGIAALAACAALIAALVMSGRS